MIGLAVVAVGLAAALFLVARRLHQTRATMTRLESRLAAVLSQGGVALSIWGEDGRLVACNERFREYYPDTPLPRGLELEDLLRFTATRGFVEMPEDEVTAWVAERLAAAREPGRTVVRTVDGRWVAIDVHATDVGEIMMVYLDVTREREVEATAVDLEQQRDARRKDAELLRRAVDRTSAAESLDAAAPELVKDVCEWAGWTVGLAHRVEGPDGPVKPIPASVCVTDAVVTEVGETLGRRGARPEPEGLVRRVMQSKRVIWVAHLDTDPTFSSEERGTLPGLFGACGVPVVRRGRVVAVLEFLSPQPLVPSPSRTAVLESVGRLLGLADSVDR